MSLDVLCPNCGDPLSGKGFDAYCPRCIGRALLMSLEGDDPDEANGTLRLGAYDLGAELGRGAMGVVYRACHRPLKREVALKLILSSRFAGEAARKRFVTEAELAAQLDHPHIVPIYEVGESAEGPFYAMKLLEGGTLMSIAQSVPATGTDGPTAQKDARWAASMMVKIARAVHHAHQRGVLHRDLKPANILLDSQGEPHITDFGLARELGVDSSLTQSGSSIGTPAYMSPEQARGEKGISTVSDVWSLGAILYHLLAGRPPFGGNTAVEVMRRVMDEEPEPFSERYVHRPGTSTQLDPDLETICLKCLRKEPNARYATAGELALDLERWLNHEPIHARPVSTGRRFALWCRRRPATLVVWVTLIMVAVVGLFAWQWRWETELRDTALREVQEKLVSQTVSAMRAERNFGQPGRRLDSLPRIATTAQIVPTVTLRNEAIARLALFDLQDAGLRVLLPRNSKNIAFTADLAQIAQGDGADGVVDFFRLSDGMKIRSAKDMATTPGWLRVSPDARWLGGRWYNRIAITDLDQASLMLRLDAGFGDGPEREFTFSPKGDRVAVRFNKTSREADEGFKVFSLTSGEELLHWKSPQPDLAYGIAYSPEGSRIAFLQRNWITVLGATNAARLWVKKRTGSSGGDAEVPWAFAWHPSGESLIVADTKGNLEVWSENEPLIRLALPGRLALPSFLQFGPDGDWLLAVTENNQALIWDYPGQRLLFRLDARIHAATVSADFRRIGYVRDLTTKPVAGIWEPRPSDVFREIFVGHTAQSVRLSSEGEWLIVQNANNEFDVHRVTDRRRVKDPESIAKASSMAEASYRFEGAVVSPPQGGGIRWTAKSSLGHGAVGHVIGRENAGFMAYTEASARVRLLNINDGTTLCDLTPPDPEPVLDLAADSSGYLLAVLTQSGRVQLWNLRRLRAELAQLHLDWGK